MQGAEQKTHLGQRNRTGFKLISAFFILHFLFNARSTIRWQSWA